MPMVTLVFDNDGQDFENAAHFVSAHLGGPIKVDDFAMLSIAASLKRIADNMDKQDPSAAMPPFPGLGGSIAVEVTRMNPPHIHTEQET